MAKEPFTDLIVRMDRTADASGNAKTWWSQVALCLVVWSSCSIPVASFDPRVHDGLKELFAAYTRFGSDLRTAADARAFS